jgi:mannose-6-phosphate isomerase-like protein (cupin superfamily)
MDQSLTRTLLELLPPEKEIPFPAVRKSRQQSASVDHWTNPVLLERAAYLSKMAKYGSGLASETLKEYPQHSVELCFQSRDGDAEAHENFTDIVLVLEGCASIVTGGCLLNAATVGPGEMRGSSLEGGTRRPLRAGDIIHIPAGQPHQVIVSGEKTIACLVLKVTEGI